MSVDAILSAASSLRFATQLGLTPLTRRVSSGTFEGERSIDPIQSDRLNPLRAPSFQAQLEEFIEKLKLENERMLILGQESPESELLGEAEGAESRADRLRESLIAQSQVGGLAELSLGMAGGLDLMA